MSKKRKRLIIIGIVFIFVCLCVDLLGGFRWRMVLKTKITYDSVLTKYIENHEKSLTTIAQYLIENPDIYFTSSGSSITMCNLNIRGDEGDKDWETKVPEDVAQALKVNLLRNHREIYIDYTVLRFENGVQFNPNSGGNSEFGGAVTILIFLRTDGIKEALWWSGNLYQEVVTWVGDFYISYGVMKRG